MHHANPYASAFNALHPNQFGSNVHSYSHVTSPYQRHDFQIRRSASEPVQDLQPTNRLITNATANSNNNNNNNNNYNKDNNNQSQEHCSPTISVVSDNKQGEFDLLPKITTIKVRIDIRIHTIFTHRTHLIYTIHAITTHLHLTHLMGCFFLSAYFYVFLLSFYS